MPLVKLVLSDTTNIDKSAIMKEISIIAGEVTGKGEKSLMVIISNGDFFMRGESSKCAFVDIRGIGKINKEINSAMSKRISEVLINKAYIPANNIYLNFTDIPRENWGHSKGVF